MPEAKYSLSGTPFSTWDQDNDSSEDKHCATRRAAGWWYTGCGRSNILGLYDPGKDGVKYMIWKSWRGSIALARITMMIRKVF